MCILFVKNSGCFISESCASRECTATLNSCGMVGIVAISTMVCSYYMYMSDLFFLLIVWDVWCLPSIVQAHLKRDVLFCYDLKLPQDFTPSPSGQNLSHSV